MSPNSVVFATKEIRVKAIENEFNVPGDRTTLSGAAVTKPQAAKTSVGEDESTRHKYTRKSHGSAEAALTV